MRHLFFTLFITLFTTSFITAQDTNSLALCELDFIDDKLTFLSDGTFQNEQVVKDAIIKLEPCGIDGFDAQFFGTLRNFSKLLSKMTVGGKNVESLTYKDLLEELKKVMSTTGYKKIRAFSELSGQLSTRVGNYENWENDKQLFIELGSSNQIMDKVEEYLKNNRNNTLTYKEILEKLQK